MRMPMLLLVTAACVACGNPPAAEATTAVQEPAGAVASAMATEEAVERLPLELGFFVAADTPCAEASNATLQLHHGKGFNMARTACEFSQILKTGEHTYSIHESCTELMSGSSEESTWDATITSPTSFAVRYEGSNEDYLVRHCPQSELPEPWRDNDLSDLLSP